MKETLPIEEVEKKENQSVDDEGSNPGPKHPLPPHPQVSEEENEDDQEEPENVS